MSSTCSARLPGVGAVAAIAVAGGLAGFVFTWTGTGGMFADAMSTLLGLVTRASQSDNVSALNGLTQLGALLSGIVLGHRRVAPRRARRWLGGQGDRRPRGRCAAGGRGIP